MNEPPVSNIADRAYSSQDAVVFQLEISSAGHRFLARFSAVVGSKQGKCLGQDPTEWLQSKLASQELFCERDPFCEWRLVS